MASKRYRESSLGKAHALRPPERADRSGCTPQESAQVRRRTSPRSLTLARCTTAYRRECARSRRLFGSGTPAERCSRVSAQALSSITQLRPRQLSERKCPSRRVFFLTSKCDRASIMRKILYFGIFTFYGHGGLVIEFNGLGLRDSTSLPFDHSHLLVGAWRWSCPGSETMPGLLRLDR